MRIPLDQTLASRDPNPGNAGLLLGIGGKFRPIISGSSQSTSQAGIIRTRRPIGLGLEKRVLSADGQKAIRGGLGARRHGGQPQNRETIQPPWCWH
jgi:hypothetical protein